MGWKISRSLEPIYVDDEDEELSMGYVSSCDYCDYYLRGKCTHNKDRCYWDISWEIEDVAKDMKDIREFTDYLDEHGMDYKVREYDDRFVVYDNNYFKEVFYKGKHENTLTLEDIVNCFSN